MKRKEKNKGERSERSNYYSRQGTVMSVEATFKLGSKFFIPQWTDNSGMKTEKLNMCHKQCLAPDQMG